MTHSPIYPLRCRRRSRKKLAQKKLAQEKTCHVGQITCICSPSQELSPRRETGRGLFESDGDSHSRAHSPSLSAHGRQTRPRGSPSEPVHPRSCCTLAFRKTLRGARQNNVPSRRGQHDGLPDIAFPHGPGRDRSLGGVVVSAKIIPFAPLLHRKREPAYFPPAALRKLQPGDPVCGAGLGVRGE
jgi:hypothetical protein